MNLYHSLFAMLWKTTPNNKLFILSTCIMWSCSWSFINDSVFNVKKKNQKINQNQKPKNEKIIIALPYRLQPLMKSHFDLLQLHWCVHNRPKNALGQVAKQFIPKYPEGQAKYQTL